MKVTEDAAREYSESLGMIGAGWWRQVAWAHQQGIPAALGMTTREWVVSFVGGWTKLSLPDRKAAALELVAEGLSQRAAADVLGVDAATVRRDLAAANAAPDAESEQAAAANAAPELPAGRYRCIVIDPPWPMDKIARNARPKQAYVEGRGQTRDSFDYRRMSLEDIAKLPIGDLADDGCHVYLWTTQRFLPAAMDCFVGWGVRYECLLTWVKNVGPTPFSWMYDTEHVLFGRLGKLALAAKGLRLSFSAPVTTHSEKPDVFYTKVAVASPGPRLEMFARRQRDGFEPWGDQVAA